MSEQKPPPGSMPVWWLQFVINDLMYEELMAWLDYRVQATTRLEAGVVVAVRDKLLNTRKN